LSYEKDIYLGECKCRARETGIDVYEKLKERSKLFFPEEKTHLMIFSHSGFSESLRQVKDVSLFSFDDFFKTSL